MVLKVKGEKTTLEEVVPADAADICALRNDEKISRFLSSSRQVSVEEQRQWIENNLAKGDGHYFRILDEKGGFCGTASLYNVLDNEAEFGRFICTRTLQAVETEYLVIRHAFETMGLRRIYCRTAVENKKVWKMHYSYGFVDAGEEAFSVPGKDMVLRIQELTLEQYGQTDYSFISKLMAKF